MRRCGLTCRAQIYMRTASVERRSHRNVLNLALQCALEVAEARRLLHRAAHPERAFTDHALLLLLVREQLPPAPLRLFGKPIFGSPYMTYMAEQAQEGPLCCKRLIGQHAAESQRAGALVAFSTHRDGSTYFSPSNRILALSKHASLFCSTTLLTPRSQGW